MSDKKVLERAGDDMVILLAGWRAKRRRQKIYRVGLLIALAVCIVVLATLIYQKLDSNIPSHLYIRAGKAQSLHLNVPATGQIVSVGKQGTSNIPKNAISIDLNRPVTIKAGAQEQYNMVVKLFGLLPFKQVGIHVVEEQELIPIGVPIGLYIKTEGILVIGNGEFLDETGRSCSPAKYILKSGDYIQKMNGKEVNDKDVFIEQIEECDGTEIVLTVLRDNELMDCKIKPVKNQSGKYKIGVWVRDDAQGVGTMTYIDGNGDFGALGHGISDLDTGSLMEQVQGTLYRTRIVDIRKGQSGEPGEMTGLISYMDSNILGDIYINSDRGIFGHCNKKAYLYASGESMPICFKQEIKADEAQIMCAIDEEIQLFDVQITKVHLDHDNVNRGIELKVTDQELLKQTGGIVQGMSGAPILQNGKIVGAVTHVLVNDPTRGYGIFIENMLEAARMSDE